MNIFGSPKNSFRMTTHLLIVVLAGCVVSLSAATVTGKITDANTGEFLTGANVMLVGTSYGAAADRTGTFRIPNVPPGNYTIEVRFIGYEKYSEEISVTGERRQNRFDVALNISYVEMDEVVVSGLRQGQAKALSQQQSSDHIENIISSDQIESFPDPNAAEALRRLPGISVQQDHGEGRYILIRGTEARLNSTQINGNNIPSPEDDNRNVSLDVIPSDLLGAIEVSKAITPDMDGDAIGGSVNLITKNAFDYDGQVIKADVSGGFRNLRGDLGQKMTFTYGNQFMNGRLGVLLGGSFNNSDMATDNVEMEWNDEYEWVTDVVDDFEVDEDDPTDTTYFYETDAADGNTLNAMELRVYDLNRKRLGFNVNLDYILDTQSRFYMRFLHNTFTDYEYRQLLGLPFEDAVDDEEPGSGYLSETEVTGAPIVRELKDRKSVSVIRNIQLGGIHEFDKLTLDYNLSSSFAEEVRDPSRDIVFESSELFDITFENDTKYPAFNATNGDGFSYNDLSIYEFDEMEYKDGEKTFDRNTTMELNAEVPYSFGTAVGSFKFGGKYRGKEKESDKTSELIYEWDGDDDLTAEDFEMKIEGEEFMDGNYSSTVGLDPDKFESYWKNSSDFISYPGVEAAFFETWEATEDVTAFYGMTTVYFGKFMVLGGARMEMTSTSYNGWVGNLGDLEDAAEEGATDFSNIVTKQDETKEYSTFLPMIHVRYNLNDKTVFRTAFTKSLARPDYINLVPTQMLDDDELILGNTDLEPTISTNLDLMVEYYVGSLGIMSAGFFSKTLSDYIYMKYTLYDGDHPSGNADIEKEIQPVNGEDATLSGFEISWQQQLTFLPGALNGLGIYLNYTNTQSEAHYIFEEREPTTLPGQAKHVGNFALSYEKAGFSARLSANFHGKYIFEIGEEEDEDIWYADNTQLDFSASYKLRRGILLYGDVMNILNTPLVYYVGDEDHPIQQELYSYRARMGVKFDF